jgi:hypothetical protein
MLLNAAKRRRSLSMHIMQRTQWRTLIHFVRANGPVALSSLGAYLMLCSNKLLILYYLVSKMLFGNELL